VSVGGGCGSCSSCENGQRVPCQSLAEIPEAEQKIREPNEAAREAMRRVAERAIQRKKPAFLFVNNRLEGQAPTAIEAVAEGLG
jgi:hypothetical protein